MDSSRKGRRAGLCEGYCYGVVPAKALLKLVETGKIQHVLYVREDVLLWQDDIRNNRDSVAALVQYEKYHGQFEITANEEGKKVFRLCGYYDI